jgi:hypothetical protein
MVVKLVSTDGNELPFKGFVLIPEDRLATFEKVASASRKLGDVMREGNRNFNAQAAMKALDDAVSELEKVWDIPQMTLPIVTPV